MTPAEFDAQLAEALPCEDEYEAAWGFTHPCDASEYPCSSCRYRPAVRALLVEVAKAQREGVPHLFFSRPATTGGAWVIARSDEASDHDRETCARLGGRCASLVTGGEGVSTVDEQRWSKIAPARQIRLSDLWDAFERGAKEALQNPGVEEDDILRAADAYVKLWLARQEDS